MKKIIVFLLVSVMVLSLCGCSRRSYADDDMLESEFTDDDFCGDIKLEICSDVDSESQSVELRFENFGKLGCSYDGGRRLEVKIGKSWYIVPDRSPAVEVSLLHLPSGCTDAGELTLSGHYGQLPRGQYRIVKKFCRSDGAVLIAAGRFSVK